MKQTITENFLRRHFILSHNLSKLPTTSTILVCNYCHDRAENLVYLLLPTNCTLISAKCIQDVFGVIDNHIQKKEKKGTFNYIQKQVDEKMKAGNSIFAYVTSHKERRYGQVGDIRSGLFRIAQKLGVTITPLAIDHIYTTSSFHIPYQNFRIKVGVPQFVMDIEQSMKDTQKFFLEQLEYFTKNKFRGIEHV